MKTELTRNGITLTPESFWEKVTLRRLFKFGIESATLGENNALTLKHPNEIDNGKDT